MRHGSQLLDAHALAARPPQGLLEQRNSVSLHPPLARSTVGPSFTSLAPRCAMAVMAQDLRFLMSERGVPADIIGHFESTGIVSLSLFFLSADSKAEMRTFLRGPPFSLALDVEGLDAAERVRRTVAQAQVLDAWVAAEARVKERSAVEATQRAGSLPLTLPAGEHVVLRRRYEDAYGRVEEAAYPSDSVIDRRLQEIELNSLVAEPLSDVTSRLEGGDDPLSAIVDRDGSLRLRKGSAKVPLPPDSEALRRRLNVLAVSYVIAKDRSPATAWLRSSTHDAWRAHVEYILGEKVYGLRIPGLEHKAGPDWNVVLAYEHAVRKEAIRGILYEGLTFVDSMAKARSNTELRELAFVAPTMAAIFGRGRHGGSSAVPPPTKKAKKERAPPAPRSGKGAGKSSAGKSSGKVHRSSKNGWHVKTADGTPICYAYNSSTERCDGKCGRVHCCQVCLGSHPACQHPGSSSSAAPATTAV